MSRIIGWRIFCAWATWEVVWLIVACPVWESRNLFHLGMRMWSLGMIALVVAGLIFMWTRKP